MNMEGLSFREAISRENFRRNTGRDPPNLLVHVLWLVGMCLAYSPCCRCCCTDDDE